MATKKKTESKGNTMKAWEIGGAVTGAVLAAAAGAYLLSDKKRRAKAKKWALDMRAEVVKNVKLAKKLGERDYSRIVDQVTKRYGSLENITAAEVIAVGKELKNEWKRIRAEADRVSKSSTAKKSTQRSATKKSASSKSAKKSRG